MTETKKKQPGMAQLTIILFLITAVTSMLLGFVNYITADKIAQINLEKTSASMQEVMPGVTEFKPIDKTFGNPLVYAAFEAEGKGYVIQVRPSGFGGTIDMVVGISNDGTVTGVSIIKMAETSGLGDNANKPEFTGQYVGLSAPAAVNKDGGDIDALTGATVTSRAVTNGVNAAIEAVGTLG